MTIVNPRYELKLNNEYVDEILHDETLDQDKIILQQFEGEEEYTYMCLNNLQIKIKTKELLDGVKFITDNK